MIFQYVWGTNQFEIHYISGGVPLLIGFTNLDWDENPNDQKYTICYVFILSPRPISLGPIRNNRLFIFLKKKQSTKKRLIQVKNPCGFDRSFHNLDSNKNI
jgi:hypothetical protein